MKEIFVAIKLSRTMSKQWILTQYLNTIYLGQGSYGIDAAAETYFGKPVWQMNAAQAAVLAAIIQQPSTYPLPEYHTQLVARWHYVLNGMVSMGVLTQAQVNGMTFPSMNYSPPRSTGSDPWDAYVMDEVQNELESQYGYTEEQVDNDGLKVVTTVNRSLMKQLYAAVDQNVTQMDADGKYSDAPGTEFESYMHVGAVLENPATGAIEAMYPGPGQNMSKNKCIKYDCDMNTTLSREQVGSSFKPYVLATAIQEGMNAQTSLLNGFSPLWVTPDTSPMVPSSNTQQGAAPEAYKVTNDSDGNYGGINSQLAMALSVNSAYTDLAHRVTTENIIAMAQTLGVNTKDAGAPNYGSGLAGYKGQVGMALGIASLTVTEQATMLAAIDNGGTYHSAHIVEKVLVPTQGGGVQTLPAKVVVHPVFSQNPTLNQEEDSQLQWAMSKDDTSYGTAPNANLGTGQEIIAKTGTTNTAQSAFFIGAIPNYALAVGMFTNEQNGDVNSETLNNLGALADQEGGYGGTWPADIWHTFGVGVFNPLGIETFPAPVFTGQKWNELSASEQASLHKKAKPKKKQPASTATTAPPSTPGALPTPTQICPPGQFTCPSATPPSNGIDQTPTPTPTTTGFGFGGLVTPGAGRGSAGASAGAAVAGSAVALPLALFWVRKRGRRGRRRS
jgi:membrane peptidoglycan carboxypeptidase